MSHATDGDTGARIAAARRLHDLTQHGLALRAHVSRSLIAQVESGAKPASPVFAAACERALGMAPGSLDASSRPEDTDGLTSVIEPIRSMLDLYDLAPDEGVQPRSLTQLRAAVREVNRIAQAANYRTMCLRLPALLAELHAAAHLWSGTPQQEAWGLLAEAYRCGHTVGIALGMTDLSAVALSRMDWAAQRAGARGPALRAAREYLRVTAYLRRQDYEACRRLNAAGHALLDGAEARDPGADVARGQLHLGAAVIAARTGDRTARAGHLEEAERYAARTGEDLETFWFGFGPTNVTVHRAMTWVELGEYDRAAQAGDVRFPSGWLPTRIGHHYFDQARAFHWMNRPAAAMRQLQRARRVAPQQAKRHPEVRRTVQMMLESPGREPAGLPQYARWIGAA